MMPAQAVPWPTRSTASSVVDDLEPVRAVLDPEAPDEAAADRRVIGLDARVDDGDGDARAVRVAEHGGPVHGPERPLPSET